MLPLLSFNMLELTAQYYACACMICILFRQQYVYNYISFILCTPNIYHISETTCRQFQTMLCSSLLLWKMENRRTFCMPVTMTCLSPAYIGKVQKVMFMCFFAVYVSFMHIIYDYAKKAIYLCLSGRYVMFKYRI